MANKRISGLTRTATSFESDDFIVTDSPTGYTRKMAKGTLLDITAQNALASVDSLTAKTSFASGDKIAVVNGSTATAMGKDDLLKETAQNALAGNVAPAFVPNETNAVAGMPYVYNGKVYVAKENYNGVWDASKFEHFSDSSVFFEQCKIIDRGSATITQVKQAENKRDGWCYTLSDSGLLNNGSLLVKAGEKVVWDVANNLWLLVKPDVNVGEMDADFSVSDENGNSIFEIRDGYMKTKNFDSETAVKSVQVVGSTLVMNI